MSRVKIIIPADPNHPDALIDACLAFFPEYFVIIKLTPLVGENKSQTLPLPVNLPE